MKNFIIPILSMFSVLVFIAPFLFAAIYIIRRSLAFDARSYALRAGIYIIGLPITMVMIISRQHEGLAMAGFLLIPLGVFLCIYMVGYQKKVFNKPFRLSFLFNYLTLFLCLLVSMNTSTAGPAIGFIFMFGLVCAIVALFLAIIGLVFRK